LGRTISWAHFLVCSAGSCLPRTSCWASAFRTFPAPDAGAGHPCHTEGSQGRILFGCEALSGFGQYHWERWTPGKPFIRSFAVDTEGVVGSNSTPDRCLSRRWGNRRVKSYEPSRESFRRVPPGTGLLARQSFRDIAILPVGPLSLAHRQRLYAKAASAWLIGTRERRPTEIERESSPKRPAEPERELPKP